MHSTRLVCFVTGPVRNPFAGESGDAVALYLGLATSRTADLNNSLVSRSNSRDESRNLPRARPFRWPPGSSLKSISIATRQPSGVSIDTAGQSDQRLTSWGGHRSAELLLTPTELPQAVPRFQLTCPTTTTSWFADFSDVIYVLASRSHGIHLSCRDGNDAHAEGGRTRGRSISSWRVEGEGREAFRIWHSLRTFTRIREQHATDVPLTLFYAFKQAESDDLGTASTGWETMLNGLMAAGLMVTATWPMRTERGGRRVA